MADYVSVQDAELFHAGSWLVIPAWEMVLMTHPTDFPMRCSVCGFDIEDEDELAFTESGAACHEECREEWELL